MVFVVVIFLSLLSTTVSQITQGCPLDWTLFGNNCYLFAIYPPLSYEEADKTCLGKGAGLVSVNTEEENSFLSTNIQQIDINRYSLWYTSASYYDKRLKWEGDGTFGSDDDRFWINPASKQQTLGMRVAYQYTATTSTYKWTRVTEDVVARYICEMPLAEISRMLHTNRDFTFGTDILDTQLAPRGPIMKIQPENVVITTRSNQPNLECMAYGIPQPTYTWLRGDNLQIIIRPSTNYVLTNGKLTFQNVTTEIAYSGSYQCKAENEFGSILSNVVRITHGFLNEFSNVVPGRYNVSLYKGTYLNCNFPTFKPAANFQWQKGSEFLQTSLNQYYFLSSDGNLYFSEVQAQDSGYYHCLVTLASLPDETMWTSQPPSTTSKGIYLNVTGQTAADFPPEIQDAFPKVFPSTPMRGFKIEVECLAYGRMPLEYSWTRIGKPMPQKAYLKDLNRVLVIDNAQFEDEGTYICHVRSNKGTDQKQFTFALSAKPYFIHPLQDMHMDINSQLTWRCEAVARPRATFKWYKNSKPITPIPGKIEMNSNVLKLTNLEETDSGMYQCAASNVYGSVFSGAQLRVLSFPPSFTRHPLPNRMLAALNGNITIPCQPEAAPAVTIQWLHNGQAMALTAGTVSTQGPQLLINGDLQITKVTVNDAGIYTCQADNNLGSAQTTTELKTSAEIVMYPPPLETVVNWNSTAFLRCQVSYDYERYDLIYVWKFNGQIIDIEEDPYFILTRQVNLNGLTIRYAQFKHAGDYECIAMTTVTSTSSTQKLIVNGPPGEPSGIYGVKGTATPYSIKLMWTEAPPRGSPVLKYIIEAMTSFNPVWRQVGEVADSEAKTPDAIDPSKRHYTVTGLFPYNSYTFRIYAKNVFPMKGTLSIPSKAYALPGARPEFPATKVSGGGGTFAALTMTWKPLTRELEGGPEIGYIAYYRRKGNSSPYSVKRINGRQSTFVTTLTANDYYLQYEIIIGVFNRYGNGPNSTMAVIYSAEGIPPHPPTGVSGGAINGTALLVTWNPMQNTRAIIHGTIQGFEINVVDLNDPNRKSVTAYHYGVISSGSVIGLEPNADFWVTVQVFNTAGESFYSEKTRISTNAEPPRHYPEYVTVRSHGSDSVFVKWRGVLTGINEEVLIGYKLRWYAASDDINTAKDVIVPNRKTEGIIYGVEKQIVYKLRVLGYSNGGNGKMSPVVYFTLGGQGVPVTDPAMTEIVASSTRLQLSLTLFCLTIVFKYLVLS